MLQMKKKKVFFFYALWIEDTAAAKEIFHAPVVQRTIVYIFDAINRSISLRAKLYFTIWKLQHITLVREKSPKIPSPFLQYLSVPRQPVRTSDHEVQLRYEEAHPGKEK